MPVIQGGRWQRLLQKYFGIKAEIVASELAPEIYPTLDMGRLPVETRLLEGWRSYVQELSLAALAANNAHILLQNPASSGVLVVVEYVEAALTAANDENGLRVLTFPNQGITVTARGNVRDTRAGLGLSVANLRAMYNVGLLGTLTDQPYPDIFGVTKTYFHDVLRSIEWVLAPGDQLAIASQAVNVTLDTTWFWKERALEPSEVTA